MLDRGKPGESRESLISNDPRVLKNPPAAGFETGGGQESLLFQGLASVKARSGFRPPGAAPR
jgi:hypothetical protein